MASAQALRAWACLAQSLLLACLCLTQPVQAALQDDQPVLHATYYSARKVASLYVNEPVIIDASCRMLYGHSTLPSNSTMVFCFNTGGQPTSSADTVCNNDGLMTLTYDTPGWKSVWAGCHTVANMEFTPDDAIFGGPSTTLRLYVQPKRGCFSYGATTDLQAVSTGGSSISLPPSAHTTVYLRVYNPQDSQTDTQLLSQQFAQLGDYPSVRLLPSDAYLRRNWPGGISHTGIFENAPAGSITLDSIPVWDPVKKAWAITVESKAEPDALIAVIYSAGVTVMGCSVEVTRILVYVPAFQSNMPPPQKDILLPSGPIHISRSTCSLGAAVLVLTGTSIVIATDSSWGASTQAVDLNALLGEAETEVTIQAAAMLCSDVLLLTSRGLVRWTPKAKTATLLDGLSLDNVASAAISVQPSPFGSADPYVYILVSSSGAMQTYWSRRGDWKTWTKSHIESAARITTLRDYYYNRTLHLVTASDATNAQLWQEDDDQGRKPMLLYAFQQDAKVMGISMPCSGADLYAFGSAIWHAPDTNSSIRLLQSLPASAMRIACSAGGGVAFLTDASQVYYSRRGLNQLAAISTPSANAADSLTPVAFGINFDWQGELHFLEVQACNTSAATAVNNGQKIVVANISTLHNTSLCITATTLPLDSELLASDMSTAATLAPSGFHTSVLSAVAAAQAPFEASSLGRIVVADMVEVSGAVVIGIEGAKFIVELPVNTAIKAATVADSPAQQQELTISAIDDSVGSAAWLILSPYVPTTVALATATGPIGVNAMAVFSSAGWLFSDVGKTVMTGQNSATITQFVNSSHAQAIVSAPSESKHFAVAAGQWQLLDFRAYREEARTSFEQRLRVFASDPGTSKYFTASLSDGWMRFHSTDYGKILAVGNGWGFIAGVVNSSVVSIYVRQSVAPGTYPAGSWSMYSVEPGQQCKELPHATCRARTWHLKLPPCSLVNFLGPPLTSADTVFMDMQDAATATVITDPPNTPVDITMANPQLLINSGRDKIVSADGIVVANKTVTMLARRASGFGFLALQPQRASLLCPITQLPQRVLVACPETKYITPVASLRPISNYNGTIVPPIKLMPVPTNYRPPSRFGKGVPTSKNIYNVDPSKPLHHNKFKVSRNTGRFQQCAGKADRAGCGCNATQSICQLPSESDCCTQAVAFYMQDVLVPRFLIKQVNRPDQILPLPYQLVEVNGRLDYCFMNATGIDCKNASEVQSVVMDGNNPYGIKFLGTELYNFEVVVLPGRSFCNLSTAFAVWVTHPPLKVTHWYLTISLVITMMALGMLAVYILFVYRYGTQFR